MTQIREIQAKTLLSSCPQPDDWFGLRYNFNLYRGCQHGCIYCDSRSECYQIADFDGEVLVKVNAPDLLERELPKKRTVGTLGTGSMNDPYMPVEAELNLTGRALAIIAKHQFPVHIITKSDMVLRDTAVLQRISQVYAAVSFTITTPHDSLGQKIEPRAPISSQRLAAISALAQAGVYCGVTLMPVLPWISDSQADLRLLLQKVKEAGAQYVLPSFGVTLRNRQREHFYSQLDEHFPGLRERYENLFGERYSCASPSAGALQKIFDQTCSELGLPTRMRFYQPPVQEKQLALFG